MRKSTSLTISSKNRDFLAEMVKSGDFDTLGSAAEYCLRFYLDHLDARPARIGRCDRVHMSVRLNEKLLQRYNR